MLNVWPFGSGFAWLPAFGKSLGEEGKGAGECPDAIGRAADCMFKRVLDLDIRRLLLRSIQKLLWFSWTISRSSVRLW